MSPHISVRLTDFPVLGGTLAGEVLVQADRPLATRSIVVTLVGRELVAGRGGIDFWRARALLGGPARLPAGAHRFRFRFALPGSLPPSFDSRWADIVYELTVDVDRPWWPDPQHRAWLRLRPPAQPVQLRPHRFRLASRNPDEAPPLDVSLNSLGFGPGDVLVGKVALSAEEQLRSTGVRVRLAGELRVSGRIRWVDAATIEQLAGAFTLPIPEIAPAFTSGSLALRWFVEVESLRRLGGGPSGRIEVTVLPRQEGRELPQVLPALGEGWREEELARLQRVLRVGETTIEIGPVGSELRGTLRFPSLRLGLTRGRRGKLRARFDEHARRIGQAVATGPGIALLELDDEHLVASAMYGTGEAFQRWLAEVAARLDQTRAALEPPAELRGQLPAWRTLAAALAGRLDPGALFVSAVRGLPVGLGAIWQERQVAGLRIEVDVSSLPVRFEESERVVVLDGQSQGTEALLAEIDRLVADLRARARGTPFR